jgi:hypothetical protein
MQRWLDEVDPDNSQLKRARVTVGISRHTERHGRHFPLSFDVTYQVKRMAVFVLSASLGFGGDERRI